MSELGLTYLEHLYKVWADKDHRHMSAEFRSAFDNEAETDNFSRGSTSFIVTGPSAETDCYVAFACLCRGQYNVALVSAHLIVRRLAGRWIPRWTEADDYSLSSADCLIITGLLDAETDNLTVHEKADLGWFVKDAIQNGAMIIASTNNSEADLNLLGENFGEMLENNFEVVNGTQANTNPQKTQQRSGNGKHGGNETSGKRRRKRIRKNLT